MALVILLSLLPFAAFATSVDDSYLVGTYTGEATGYKDGKVTVTVTLSEQDGSVVISDIVADGSTQTKSFWGNAVTLLDKIKDANGTDGVDAVSGATFSSNAILRATDNALGKARFAFSGGSGSAEDPYTVSSEAGLKYLAEQVAAGNDYAGQYIKLSSDIALSGEWTPIGTSSNMFAGAFDGNGHTISGLTVTDNTLGYIGLFGYVKNGTVIKNLKLSNASISVSAAAQNVYAGALVGFVKVDSKGTASTVIDNCYASGSISVSTANKMAAVGGLVGFGDQRMAVTNCGSNIALNVDSGSGRATVGGLLAWSSVKSLFMNCYSLGNVSVTTTCTSYDNVGAMFGQLNGIVYNCYALGGITLNADSPATPAAAFAGNAATAYVDSCYCADEAAPIFGTVGSGTHNSETVLKKSASEMKSEAFAALLHGNLSPEALSAMAQRTLSANVNGCTDFASFTDRVGGKFCDWVFSDGLAVLSGSLWVNDGIDSGIFAGGKGTAAEPYLIETAAQLRAFAVSLNDKIDYTGCYIALSADIDISDAEWTPIGGSDYLFNGTFDGKGHSIIGMTIGTADKPYEMDSDHIYIGLFGVLGPKSVIRDLNLKDVSMHTVYAATGFVGGIAAVTQGSTAANDLTGPVIDSCSVSATISHTGGKGNQFVAGFVGMQYKGAIINCSASINVSGVVTSGDLAEVGGLVGLNNRGLVANCLSDSNVYGSGNRDNGNEGMAAVSNLIACNAGALANCRASGDVSTWEHSTYAGMVSGWVTGIGKSYSSWYDLDSSMTLKLGDKNPQKVEPVESIGTKVSSGVSDEGDAYTGGLVDKMTGYDLSSRAKVADGLNASFASFPIDITAYGLSKNALKNWTYDAESGFVGFADSYGEVTYVQPECEKYVAPQLSLRDGTWYGRDNDKTTVVKITVADGKVANIEVISGESSGDAFDAAVKKAEYKSTYGDTTHYNAPDASKFGGGKGTAEDPYIISSEAQLRYLSSSVNEDVDWSGVYFLQTADIALSGGDWTPIGWSIDAEVDGARKTVCVYPFRGNYDGGDHIISGLSIGSAESPADQTTSGLFGLVCGAYATNEKPDGTEQISELKNIHLRDIGIYVSTRYQTYTGGLVGSAQNGVYIDNCSVTGKIETTTSESFARGGGLVANILRCGVTNSWADVDIVAVTDTNHVYAGGLFGMDNRVTAVNCYALGDISGNSTNNNKVHIGGLVGQAGGVHINCYAYGNVVSYKTTTDVGALNGRAAGINVEYNCYFNSEAIVKQGNTTVSPAVANGVTVSSASEINVVGKTASELASEEFAKLLNDNITAESMEAALKAVNDALENTTSGLVQINYYRGEKLLSWAAQNGVVGFGEVEAPATDDKDPSTDGGEKDPVTGDEKDTPKTGDDRNFALLAIILAFSGTVMVLIPTKKEN